MKRNYDKISKYLELATIGLILGFFIGMIIFGKDRSIKQYNCQQEEIIGQIKVIEDYINTREYPNISSETFGQVKKSETYDVLDKFNDGDYQWYKIKYQDKIVFVASGIKTAWVEEI